MSEQSTDNVSPAEQDRRKYNEWVDSLIADVEWEPLKYFLERLKEPEGKE